VKIVMNCRQIRKKLSAFQDGELSAGERTQVSTHLCNCPSCRSVYAELEDVWQSLNMINEIEPSPGFNRNLYWKIHAPADQCQKQWFPRFWQLFPANVFTVVLLLTGLVLGAFLGDAFVTVGPWSITHQTSYSRTPADFDSFKVFAPLPPGTLGNSYIRMASATEGYPK
jgi:predicted anti-sigma-YlaC factor YlaD